MRGVLSALTRPASLPQLVREHAFSEALFYETLAELHASGRLPGSLQGKTTYTPTLHVRAQQASIGSFYEQNGVIEYAALTKLQVKDPQAYMRERQPQVNPNLYPYPHPYPYPYPHPYPHPYLHLTLSRG